MCTDTLVPDRNSKHNLVSFDRYWFGFFVKWYINLHRLFNAKAILVGGQQWYNLTYSLGDNGVQYLSQGY